VEPLPFIAHLDDLSETEGAYPAPFDAEKLTIYKDLGRATGTKTVGFGHERLLPGRRTSFTHAHELEEEFVFVVSGTCHVRLVEPGREPREVPLRAGHAVAFPAGTGIAHTFVNHGTEECVLFIAGERRPTDRWFYPEDPAYDAHFGGRRPERYWQRGAIRTATEADSAVVLDFLARKAAFDRSMDSAGAELVATADDLKRTLFGTTPYAWARLAEKDGAVVGFALYYFRYSSFRGRPSLWLDDLYVLESARSTGVGGSIMRDLLAIAARHGASHLAWTVAAKNTRGQAFYERLGATVTDRGGAQWTMRLEAPAPAPARA
jgi:uncharacterized cupin superfamily protein/GNAT superfamily N-acetyltransferase